MVSVVITESSSLATTSSASHTSSSATSAFEVVFEEVESGFSGEWLDVFGGDTEFLSEVLDAFIVDNVVVVLPGEGAVEVSLGVERSREHPDLEVVDTGVLVDTVPGFLDAEDAFLE